MRCLRATPPAAVAAGVLSLLVACSSDPNEFQIDSGTLRSGPWSAWVYDSLTSGVCLEIRQTGDAPERLCDLNSDNATTWLAGAAEGDAEFVAGTTTEPSAELVVVTLNGGEQIEAEVHAAGDPSALRFFVLTIGAGADATQLDLLDGDGTILESRPME